mmetsp:Transcript_10498/g.43734  ORF Transcript_10498/g.43734 Transcript_10498/m.43734 type:complete len:139 (+) Transcript_10498:1750-2166(+)
MVLKHPKVIVLDESTSALDTRTERAVQAALNDVSKGKTTLVIARTYSPQKDEPPVQFGLSVVNLVYFPTPVWNETEDRLSTIADADEILVLKNGVITERGTHSELMKIGEDGDYFTMWTAQAAAAASSDNNTESSQDS